MLNPRDPGGFVAREAQCGDPILGRRLGPSELDYATLSGEIPPGIFRESLMRKLIVLAAAASALWISGCNTVAGMGKDVTAAGKAVTSTADDVKR